MRSVCVQYQPGLASGDAAALRAAWVAALPSPEVVTGDVAGRYVNLIFEAVSPDAAAAFVRQVLRDPELGTAARRSCVVLCEGEIGWSDYLVLHHFDPTMPTAGR